VPDADERPEDDAPRVTTASGDDRVRICPEDPTQRVVASASKGDGSPDRLTGGVMAKINAGLFVTLDGVAERPESWNPPYFDGEMGAELASAMASADALLLGRVTYEEWAAFWPNQRAEQNPMAALINRKRKYVVSNTLNTTEWENSTIVGGDLATEAPKLKDRSGGDLLVSGSITLVQSLLAQNLLDELSLMVHPLVLGNGRRLLESIDGTRRLELVQSKSFGSGVVSLAYRRAPGAGTGEQEP